MSDWVVRLIFNPECIPLSEEDAAQIQQFLEVYALEMSKGEHRAATQVIMSRVSESRTESA